MASVDPDMELAWDQVIDPMLWVAPAPAEALEHIAKIDTSDAAMEPWIGPGASMKLKSFGHDVTGTGVHFLLTRKGTTVHTDKAYTRFSHQLVLRNDGNRIRGLPRYDSENPNDWHPPIVPGMMYCLDTHSPHQGIGDPRIAPKPGSKAVLAVDRDQPLELEEAWALIRPVLIAHQQFQDLGDPEAVRSKTTAPRWKDPA